MNGIPNDWLPELLLLYLTRASTIDSYCARLFNKPMSDLLDSIYRPARKVIPSIPAETESGVVRPSAIPAPTCWPCNRRVRPNLRPNGENKRKLASTIITSYDYISKNDIEMNDATRADPTPSDPGGRPHISTIFKDKRNSKLLSRRRGRPKVQPDKNDPDGTIANGRIN